MAKKHQLRVLRTDTRINEISKTEDKQCLAVVDTVIQDLQQKLNVRLCWQQRIMLVDIIECLRENFPNVRFADPEKEKSHMKPDGGITFLLDKMENMYPILIAEVKNQGTNDIRAEEGKPRQAQGNAVERLGKNVIGFRTYMLGESIFPFVCFGDGCDFERGSSILDRVMTIAMFGEMNTDHTANEGPNCCFNRGSYYFRSKKWTAAEMRDILYSVAERSIYYYFSQYGRESFIF